MAGDGEGEKDRVLKSRQVQVLKEEEHSNVHDIDGNPEDPVFENLSCHHPLGDERKDGQGSVEPRERSIRGALEDET